MRNGKMWMSSLVAYGGGPTLWETSYAAWHNTYWERSGSVHSLTGWSAHGCIVTHRVPAVAMTLTEDTCWGALSHRTYTHGHRYLLTAWAPDWSKLFMSVELCMHHHEHQHHSSGRSVVFNFPSQLHRKLPLWVSAALYAFNVKVFKGRCSDVFVYACVDFRPPYPNRSHLLVLSKLFHWSLNEWNIREVI